MPRYFVYRHVNCDFVSLMLSFSPSFLWLMSPCSLLTSDYLHAFLVTCLTLLCASCLPQFFFSRNFHFAAQKNAQKFFIKDLFSKCDQIRRKLRIWSHLLKKSFMKNFFFCVVFPLVLILTYSLSLYALHVSNPHYIITQCLFSCLALYFLVLCAAKSALILLQAVKNTPWICNYQYARNDFQNVKNYQIQICKIINLKCIC